MQPRGQGQRLDLTTVEIRKFSSLCTVNRFDWGKAPIDRFLKNKAKKSMRRHECVVYGAHVGASPAVIGYYSLSVGSDEVSDMMRSTDNYVKYRASFPALHIPFLGVSREYQRQGLGSFLLMDAFQKVRIIAGYAGLYALTLQSMDAESTAFYCKLGFEAYTESEEQPKMLYPIENVLQLVDDLPVEV